MALVVDESPLHDFKELLFSRVVYLSDLCFDLMKPIFNGIKLRGIRGQVKNVHITIFAQVDRLFFVMDSAIIKDQPFLSFVLLLFSLFFCQLLLFLEDSCEELLYEVQVFVLSISTLDYSPVSQSVLGNQGYQGESFAFRDGTIYCYLLIRTGPSFISSHVQVKAAFIQEVYFSISHPNVLIFSAIVVSFLQRLCSIPFFRHTFYSLLLELAHFQESGHSCSCYFYSLPVFEEFQVLNLVQLNCQLVLSKERVFFDQSGHMFQSLQGDLSFGSLFLHVLAIYSFIKAGVLHPLHIKLVYRAVSHVEKLTDILQSDSWPFVVAIALKGIELIEFLSQQFKYLLGKFSPSVFAQSSFRAPLTVQVNIQIFELSLFSFHFDLLLFQLVLNPSGLLFHILPLLSCRLSTGIGKMTLISLHSLHRFAIVLGLSWLD